MEVILLKRVEKVGKLGDVVKVKDGFARNYLLPQNKALRANKENLSVYEKEKEKYEKLNKDKLAAAAKIANNMDDVSINIIKQASDSGQLYGSVSTKDIADAITEAGVKVTKAQVRMPLGTIRETGEFDIAIHLHNDVDTNIKVVVIAEA